MVRFELPLKAADSFFVLSPDGRWIAFTAFGSTGKAGSLAVRESLARTCTWTWRFLPTPAEWQC